MAVLYITSHGPGGGKTALASSLAARYSGEGRRVGYLKTFSNAPQEDADVAFINASVLPAVGGDAPSAAPLPTPEGVEAGGALPKGAAADLRAALERLAAANEVVIVEGPSLATAQGATSPISADLADLLDAGVVLVMNYQPGLEADGVLKLCEPFGQRLLGVLINSVTRYRERSVRLELGPAIEAGGAKFLGAVPEDRVMLAATVGQIAEHLDGRWVLGQEDANELVENFLIGGNIMDWGPTYFGRMDNKAVIVRGDRPDIQLAALATPTTCLVLTHGHQPNQYVYHQAEQQEVPLFVVETDTVSTVQALDTVNGRSSFHHPRKLERFQQLVAEHLDIGRVEAGL